MTTNYRIRYTATATNDLRSIVHYISWEKHAPQAGKALGKRIRLQIHKLGMFPESHESVGLEPWAAMGMRKLPVENYVVIYAIQHELKMVSVFRILYGGMDLPAIAAEADKV